MNVYIAIVLLLLIVLYIAVPIFAGLQAGRQNATTGTGALIGLFTSLFGAGFTTIPIVLIFIINIAIKAQSVDQVILPFVLIGYTFLTGLPGIMLGAIGGAIGTALGKRRGS